MPAKCALTHVCGNNHADNMIRVGNGLAAFNLINVFHTFDNLAPHGVLPVQEGCIVKANEELAVGAVRHRRAGHRRGTAHVGLVVELSLQVRVARAAGAAAMTAVYVVLARPPATISRAGGEQDERKRVAPPPLRATSIAFPAPLDISFTATVAATQFLEEDETTDERETSR